jgi:hypothetical protein
VDVTTVLIFGGDCHAAIQLYLQMSSTGGFISSCSGASRKNQVRTVKCGHALMKQTHNKALSYVGVAAT